MKNDMIIKAGIGLFIAVILFSLFTGGEKLDKTLKKEAKAVPEAVEKAAKKVEENQSGYDRLSRTKEFKPMESYAKKENWADAFAKAADMIKRAGKLYDTDLKPLIKKDTPEVAQDVKKQIQRIQAIIKQAVDMSQTPAKRFDQIRSAVANAGPWHEKANEDAQLIQKIVQTIETGAVAKALNDFPDMADKINARYAPASQLMQQSADHLKIVSDQYDRHQNGQTADYAAFADRVLALEKGRSQATSLESKISGQMGQLYTSYTKILQDMKEEYFVTITRESWNENSDINDSRQASFTRLVDLQTYQALTADQVDIIGTIKPGFSRSSFVNHVGAVWNELDIEPGSNWPSRSHNAAQFWVESSREAYFHNYLLENEGKTEETGWQKVSPAVYDANIEFLGMALLAKPYGTFEEDSLSHAAPPGMAYVGNSRYGEWKEDENGDRFWSWYGRYMFFSHLFFLPPSYYYYNSWYGWRNNYRYKKPYFGKSKTGQKIYGTYGTYVKKSPKFQGSHFAKSGGFKAQAASVRGAGSGLRGGGPKSKGK